MVKKLFKSSFLNEFAIDYDLLKLTNKDLSEFDSELNLYDKIFIDPKMEKNLISKNELLASFAISKAENSTLTLAEAQEVYSNLINNPDYAFLQKKIEEKKLTQKDLDKLEFLNIVKTVRKYNQKLPNINDINSEFIKNLHFELTQGLDIFKDAIPFFNVYRSGQWRNSNDIRVGVYEPAPQSEILTCLEEILDWIKNNQDTISVGIFHTALYAIHPFSNGNKRVARVLENILLRIVGMNNKNLYSTSYYYHQEKSRYYKYLIYSLEKKNFNYFVSFFQEAIVFSILTVIQSEIEVQRSQFIKSKDTDEYTKFILQALIKRKELQFGTLFKLVKKKMARQTFVNYLQKATELELVKRNEEGRSVYYSLNIASSENTLFKKLLNKAETKLPYIPDYIKLS